jgi:membrane fusion protein, multidrug efflux system
VKSRFLVAGGLVVAIGIGFWAFAFTRSNVAKPQGEEESAEKSTQVQLSAIENKAITEVVSAFGTVVPQAGKIVSINLPFETVVRHVLVTRGQSLRAADLLIQISASPAAQLQFRQALSAKELAQNELDQAEKQFGLKFATNKDLSEAQKAARDAQSTLECLQQQGINAITELRAKSACYVDKVNAQDGQLVAAGTSLVELIAGDDLEIKLGVRTDALDNVQAGQPVSLYTDSASTGPIPGQVRLVTHEVDPATGLVEVFVGIGPQDHVRLLIGAYVRGEIQTRIDDALVVPKSAVLPEDDGFYLFTVANKKAVKHTVKVGIQTPNEVEILSPDLKAGDEVVTVGNYELTDGAAVEEEGQK